MRGVRGRGDLPGELVDVGRPAGGVEGAIPAEALGQRDLVGPFGAAFGDGCEGAHQNRQLDGAGRAHGCVGAEAEVAARRYKEGVTDKKPTRAKDLRTEDRALINTLGKHLGTKTNIQKMARGGRIIIEFYSDEELERISSQILNQD